MSEKKEELIKHLFKEYSHTAFNVAYAKIRNIDDAKDIVQNVFAKVVQKIGTLRDINKAKFWIMRIAMNETENFLRKKITEREKQKKYSETYERKEKADEEVEKEDDIVVKVRSILESNYLSDIYKMPIILVDVEGMSLKDASKVLKISVPALKSRLHRGRILLRNVFKEKGLIKHVMKEPPYNSDVL